MMVSVQRWIVHHTQAELPSSIPHEELKRNKTSCVQIESESPQLKRARDIREIPRKMRRKFGEIFTREKKAARESIRLLIRLYIYYLGGGFLK